MKSASWLIFAPPSGEPGSELEKLRLVRDGFSIWPLIFGPFWFLYRKLWLAALVSLVFIGAGFAVRILLELDDPGATLVTFLPSLFFALESSTFEARKLRRQGWREVGLVIARNHLEAETKAIERLAGDMPVTAPVAQGLGGNVYGGASPVLGLFPEAAGGR